MRTFQHYIADAQNSNLAPRHWRKRGYMGARDTINLDALAEACQKRNVDVHEVIALALTEEMRAQAAESGMTMKAQSDLAWRILDKNEASKKAVEHSGDVGMTVLLQSSDADL